MIVNATLVRSVPVRDPLDPIEFQKAIKAASPELFAAVRAHVATGRLFDMIMDSAGAQVAVIGRVTAEDLGITRVEQRPVLLIGDRPFEAIAIIDDVAREPDLLDAVIIPNRTAQSVHSLAAPGSVSRGDGDRRSTIHRPPDTSQP